ncbi:DUF7557 family protein [Halobacterium zhouii]|nr:hypothetical protein [Halobacterium zhouii]
MPKVTLSDDTIERLDNHCEEDESYDELITELINIYESEEFTTHHAGDD